MWHMLSEALSVGAVAGVQLIAALLWYAVMTKPMPYPLVLGVFGLVITALQLIADLATGVTWYLPAHVALIGCWIWYLTRMTRRIAVHAQHWQRAPRHPATRSVSLAWTQAGDA